MLEAKFKQGNLLKKVVESVRDLLSEATWDCSQEGIMLQAMDNSHVSLVSVNLKADGFDTFTCPRDISMGVSIGSMSKILNCSANDDVITLKAEDNADNVTFLFENCKQDKVSTYEMKLMNLEVEHLGIPDTDFDAVVKMPSSELQKVIRNLSQFGDTVIISCSKEGIKFTVAGDIANCSVKLAQTAKSDDKSEAIIIEAKEPVSLTFALKYLSLFTKASSLTSQVILSMSPDIPLKVEFIMDNAGHICFYLAPKVTDEDI